MLSPGESEALELALKLAGEAVGATSPNPAVGAVALGSDGAILSIREHLRAGGPHAEIRVIEDCRARGLLGRIHTLGVTLEPCNHAGRTPPCVLAILGLPALRRVVIGAPDPNPRVKGKGAEALEQAGLSVEFAEGPLAESCRELIEPFTHWARTGRPWLVLKTAHRSDGSMIPPNGRKTFTSAASLDLAHRLRRRADAILTGSGTVLADQPDFTVRRVPDHPGKSRWLVILDRRRRVPVDFLAGAESRGLRPRIVDSLEQALEFLGSQDALEVLVEAGPALSRSVLETGIWSRHVVITQGDPDRVETRRGPGSDVHRNR